ncbi:MAG: hypothetical protein KGL39_41400 [Patescibacteria group bacterium]|nr:hypothetical protein [Patescibacteria group bacterium]
MLGKSAPQSQVLGQLGSSFVEDTNDHTGSWGAIQCVSACTFATLTSGNLPDGTVCMSGTLSDITMAAGMVIYGYFIDVQLATGSVILYNL